MTGVVLISAAIVYIVFVLGVARRYASKIQDEAGLSIEKQKNHYEELCSKKESLSKEKVHLEEEAVQIFTLYEMTREITKCLNEKEAFDFFKQKLKENISFKDCRLREPLSDLDNNGEKDGRFSFVFQGKNEQVGVLTIDGLEEDDREKASILSHQFALAIRRVKLYEEIEKIAITDSLTFVYTRRYFLERFEEEIGRSKIKEIPLSVFMIDVDFFKQVNDQYGHLTGDQVLKSVGGIIKENIREIDIAGRYGGEEFSIVLPDTDSAGAQFAAERIRKAADETLIKAYDAKVKTTVSIGIATFPKDGNSVTELIDKADWALYRAKKQGRNRTCIFGVYKD